MLYVYICCCYVVVVDRSTIDRLNVGILTLRLLRLPGKSSIVARFLNETVQDNGYGWHGTLFAKSSSHVASDGTEIQWEVSKTSG